MLFGSPPLDGVKAVPLLVMGFVPVCLDLDWGFNFVCANLVFCLWLVFWPWVTAVTVCLGLVCCFGLCGLVWRGKGLLGDYHKKRGTNYWIVPTNGLKVVKLNTRLS